MLTVIIPNTDEPTVIRLTYDNLRRELSSIDGSELLIAKSWEAGLQQAKGEFVCIVEPDCLVSSGYFSSNLSLFLKNDHFRKLAMIASCLGVDNWGNRIYNYKLDKVTSGNRKLSVSYWRIAPERKKKTHILYPAQVGFVPGAIFRRSALAEVAKEIGFKSKDLVELSTKISFHFWASNRRILVNPNTTYVSTDRSLENPPLFKPKVPNAAANLFKQEQL